MTTAISGWARFAAYAYPPNELGYCGPPDPSVLLAGKSDEIGDHAQGFDGAWPYLEELATAAGRRDPLDAEVVHAYWIGGRLLGLVDPAALLSRLRTAMAGQPCGLLTETTAVAGVLAHHSFHVFVVYPWIRFLGPNSADQATPLRILQSCRIRWGTVESVDDESAVLSSRPLRFDGALRLSEPTQETVRWRGADGTALAARPVPGSSVAAHWDWVCGTLDAEDVDALAAATASTLELVNRLRAR
ncbi:MAG TPA: DUF6390 family protein [Mycobacterium sp.]|nr:DUF6390 family protein [Mycobacterium sp.]